MFEEFSLTPEWALSVRTLIALTLVSTVCSVIGCLVILRRMSFLADALAHSMLAGVVGGYLIMKLVFGVEASAPGMLLGALIAGFLTVATIGFITRVSRIKQDTAIGIMYTGIFALGGFFASYKPLSQHIQVDLYHFVVGSVLSVTDTDMWMLVGVTIIVLASVVFFFRQLKLTSFDPVMAAAIGIPVVALDYLLTACASLVVVSGVTIVGVVLVVALVITPAASAYLLQDRLHRMMWVAVLFGIVSSWIGYGLAAFAGVAPGPAIVIVNTAAFILTLTLSPRYGLIADWWRRRKTVPQIMTEDVLLVAFRAKPALATRQAMLEAIGGSAGQLRKTLKLLQDKRWLEPFDGRWQLTEEGNMEAQRLLRAHRLWETYLDQVGMPAERVHETAERLEHVHDESAVDYLDDKLGHPLVDPHGSEIPEDVQRLQSGEGIKLSFLREGYRVQVVRLLPCESRTSKITQGLVLSVGSRTDDHEHWRVCTEDQTWFDLDHQAADSVEVRVVGYLPPSS